MMHFLEYIETLGAAPYWVVMGLCAALWYVLEARSRQHAACAPTCRRGCLRSAGSLPEGESRWTHYRQNWRT